MRERLNKSLKLSVILVFILALGFSITGRLIYGVGILVGASWLMANFLLTLSLLEIAVLKKPHSNLLRLLLVKFPVLYLLGFLILSLKIFPYSSLFLGMTVIILVLGVSIWPLKTKLNTNCLI
jgi:hypothetical protein